VQFSVSPSLILLSPLNILSVSVRCEVLAASNRGTLLSTVT
jgi:hypothetical protein